MARFQARLALACGLLQACANRGPRSPDALQLAVAAKDRPPEVRFRPLPPEEGSEDARLARVVPDATWDAGLDAAAHNVLRAIVDQRARLSTATTSTAAAVAGYPGQARFLRLLNGGAFPHVLVEAIQTQSIGVPVDVGLARRTFADGTVLWIVAWAPRKADVDPLPRDLKLDDALPVRVTTDHPGRLRLFVTPPNGPVAELAISAEAARWVDVFHTPGEYRIEVVGERPNSSDVLLLFSVYVDSQAPEVPRLAWHPRDTPDPLLAEEALYEALNEARREHGLPAVRPFDMFRPVVREHSAYMASAGYLGHTLDGLTTGVPDRAAKVGHPQAEFYENVAVALTPEDAHALVEDSPGHFRNLLCETCTHATIGVALEPVLNRDPRLFVTWELMHFPEGIPRPIPKR